MKKFAPFILISLITLIALMLVVPMAVYAQTPEPLICDVYTDRPADVRTSYYVGEGAGYFNAGELNEAVKSFSCIIEQIAPNNANAYASRGVVYSAQRDYDKALADYNQAIQLDGGLIPAYNNRGIVYAAQGKYDEALADFNHTLQLDANFVMGYTNRAVIKALQGDYEGAIADLQQAISISEIDNVVADLTNPDRPDDAPTPVYNPRDAQPYALLGIIYSAWALDNYQNYELLTGSQSDRRIDSAAGALESRFNFELRLDDGSWLLAASFIPGDQ